MKIDLQNIKDAMDRGDFVSARDLASAYVASHPDEFADYEAMVSSSANESEAMAKVVAACEKLRDGGLVEHQYRAEAFHLHRWHPQNIGGSSEPNVRHSGDVHPAVRNA